MTDHRRSAGKPALIPPGLTQTLEQQRRVVHVADYYRGDDAAPAFEAAIQIAAQSGASVDIGGRWVFQSACDATGQDVTLVGHATIDARMVAAPFALSFGGREGASAPLGADAGKGDDMLECALPLLPGDIVRIVSSEPWCRERPYYVKGELVRVAACEAGTVTLHGQLNDSYAAGARITRIEARAVTVQDGIELARNANRGGMLVQWARDLALNLCFVSQARERSFYLKQCLGGHVTDCGCFADHVAGGSTNYGLVYASCAEIHTVGGNYRAGRHGVTTGGTFPCRDLHFFNAVFDNDDRSGSSSLDAHANGERFSYWNVTSKNGAVVQAVDCHFVGGHYASRGFLNALSANPARDAHYYTFHSVQIDNPRPGGRGLTLSPAVSQVSVERFLFSGGGIRADMPFYSIPAETGLTRYGSIEFDGGFELVTLRDGADTGSSIGPNIADAQIGRVSFVNGRIASNGGGVALAIRSAHKTIGHAEVSACEIDHYGANDCVLIAKAGTVEFNHNICRGNGVSWRVQIRACDRARAHDNRMIGFDSRPAIGFDMVGDVEEADNAEQAE